MCFGAARPAVLFPEYQSVTKKDGIIDAILFSNCLTFCDLEICVIPKVARLNILNPIPIYLTTFPTTLQPCFHPTFTLTSVFIGVFHR